MIIRKVSNHQKWNSSRTSISGNAVYFIKKSINLRNWIDAELSILTCLYYCFTFYEIRYIGVYLKCIETVRKFNITKRIYRVAWSVLQVVKQKLHRVILLKYYGTKLRLTRCLLKPFFVELEKFCPLNTKVNSKLNIKAVKFIIKTKGVFDVLFFH